MPYSGPDDDKLPDRIKAMPVATRRHWVGAWNGAYRDCQAENGDDCEGRAFRVANAAIKEQSMSMFLFTELADDALTDGRMFDAVAFGVFTDMYGRQVELKADDALTFVANTSAAIEATRAESGELVGLPIDAINHEKGDAAGWIVGVEFANGIIRLLPRWTEIGREVIQKGIRRFFSATINTAEKVILGGTLTNWPATREKNGRMLLRPIELSQSIQTLVDEPAEGRPDNSAPNRLIGDDKHMTEEIKTEQVPEVKPKAPPAELPANALAELIEQAQKAGHEGPAQLAEIVQRTADQLAERRVAQMLESNQRQWEITALAAKLTGGGAFGLPLKVNTLTDFLLSLNADQFGAAKDIFETIAGSGVIDFSERGHGRRLNKKPVPEVYRAELQAVIDAGNTPAMFFAALGENASDYDLSEFGGEK